MEVVPKFESTDKSVLKNLSQMGEKLKELQLKMVEAAAEAERAKKEYEHYANVLLPQEMFSAGIDSLGLISGGVLRIKRNFYCQPNKNDTDKKVMTNWIKTHGGEYLLKESYTVGKESVDTLKENNIPYTETCNFNTLSLKSFLKDKLGITTGIQQITLDEIPACMHFQEVTTAEIELE